MVGSYRCVGPHGLKGVTVAAAVTVSLFPPQVRAWNPETKYTLAEQVRWLRRAGRNRETID